MKSSAGCCPKFSRSTERRRRAIQPPALLAKRRVAHAHREQAGADFVAAPSSTAGPTSTNSANGSTPCRSALSGVSSDCRRNVVTSRGSAPFVFERSAQAKLRRLDSEADEVEAPRTGRHAAGQTSWTTRARIGPHRTNRFRLGPSSLRGGRRVVQGALCIECSVTLRSARSFPQLMMPVSLLATAKAASERKTKRNERL
jgi:hypothetical protein